MIRYLVDLLFADVMHDYVLIDEMVYVPFDSLTDCICRIVLFVVTFLTLGLILAKFLEFFLRCVADWIKARKGGT